MSDHPIDFKKIFPFPPIRFEKQPEQLVKRAREQVKAGRKQYLSTLASRSDDPDPEPED